MGSTVTATSVFESGSDRQQKTTVSIDSNRLSPRAERRAALALKPGEVFNPFNLFDGPVIASNILRHSDLSPSAKLVFARLTQFAGTHGKAWPSDQTLAREVGLGQRQVRRCVAELEQFGLLRRVARLGSSNQIEFLWHSIYDEGRTEVSGLPRTETTALPRSQMSGPPRTETTTRREITQSFNSERIQEEENQVNHDANPRPATSSRYEHGENHTKQPDELISVKKRDPLDNPEAEFLLRMRERHGTSTDAKAILHWVLQEFSWNYDELRRFLDFDEVQTVAPEKLKNPLGHYRKSAQKFRLASTKEKEHGAKQRQRALLTQLNQQKQNDEQRKRVCALSLCDGTGERWDAQGYVSACECEQGKRLSPKVLQAFEQMNAIRRAQPKVIGQNGGSIDTEAIASDLSKPMQEVTSPVACIAQGGSTCEQN